MPEDGHQHVSRSRQLTGSAERIDQHQPVVGVECERGDFVLPLLVPCRPPAKPGRDLLHPGEYAMREVPTGLPAGNHREAGERRRRSRRGRSFLTPWTYAPHMRFVVAFVFISAALFAVSGCGESDRSGQGADTATTTMTTTTPTVTSGIDPLEGAGTDPVVGEVTSPDIALLERVAVGRHEGYDRVVFQFKNYY